MTQNPSDQNFRLLLRFWGVRGSTPTTGRDFDGHGGDTACVEIRLPSGEILIFDGGTGVRKLGRSLIKNVPGVSATPGLPLRFFLTHFHWDHIQGIPFFLPLFSKDTHVTFCSAREPDELRGILARQMTSPYFPVDFDSLPCHRDFLCTTNESSQPAGAVVRSFPMNHPQGASGYRVEHQGATIVYASDLEHGNPQLDLVVREYSRDADILIYDAQFTPAEYEARRGWGHSTWLEATRVARDAGVKKLVLIHHDPEHDDKALHKIVDLARGEFEETVAAQEGLVIRL